MAENPERGTAQERHTDRPDRDKDRDRTDRRLELIEQLKKKRETEHRQGIHRKK